MKKIVLLALALVLALSLVACSGNTDNDGNNSTNPPASQDSNDNTPAFTKGLWPDNDWTKQVPKPSAGEVGDVGTMGAEDKTLYIVMDWTREEAEAYCDEVIAGKFDQNVLAYYKDSTPNTVLLEAESSDGWQVAISETEIRIYMP